MMAAARDPVNIVTAKVAHFGVMKDQSKLITVVARAMACGVPCVRHPSRRLRPDYRLYLGYNSATRFHLTCQQAWRDSSQSVPKLGAGKRRKSRGGFNFLDIAWKYQGLYEREYGYVSLCRRG